MKQISVGELKNKIEGSFDGHMLIDVREPFEHKTEAIPGAENIPQDELTDAIGKLKGVDTVYVHCRTGARSSRACARLEREGVNVVNVEGGIEGWKEAGFEIEKRGNKIPLVRQVMISAGSLVLLGMALGYYIDMRWYALPVFVAGGLVFAGVSGKCAMAEILKHMPWNS